MGKLCPEGKQYENDSTGICAPGAACGAALALAERFEIDSAAVSREEIGNPVYPAARLYTMTMTFSCWIASQR